MKSRRRPRRVAARTLAALVLLSATEQAAADGIGVLIQPQFSITHLTSTVAGLETFTETTQFGQVYRLDLDRHIYPFLDLNLGGTFHQTMDWITSNAGYAQSQDTSGTGYITLLMGGQVLGASVGYQRQMDASGVVLATAPTNVNDTYFATFNWRPLDLPAFTLRLDRSNTYDSQRTQHDTTTSDALLSVQYGIENLNLLYSLRWTDAVDNLHGVDDVSLNNSIQASYNDRWFGGRSTVYVSALLSNFLQNVTASGPGGTVSTQRYPIAGLSLVESFPMTPQLDTLAPNPLLIDGITNVSANIDIGFGPSLAGDKNYRDMGVQFADSITPINTVWVYVNQQLPAQVSDAYTWTAYQSSDNLNWTAVPLAGPVVFNTLQNRFEIPIAQTQAIYVKVVTTPLPASVTTDRTYLNIFVTEIQVYQVVAASSIQGSSSITTETLNATGRTLILDIPSLFWDIAVYLNHSSISRVTTWSLINGLSLTQKLTNALSVTARAARLDENIGSGYLSQFQWSASLTASPFPTLTSALTYNGVYGHDQLGVLKQESLFLFNNATLYTGLNLLLNGGYSVNQGDTGRVISTASANVGLTAIPNQALNLSLTYNYQYTTSSGGPLAATSGSYGNLSAGVSWTPVSAVFLAASVSRIMQPVSPTTLVTGTASFSPFAGGALLLRVSYNENLDTFNQTDQRIFTPGLRWVIFTGFFLDAGYTYQRTTAPQTVQVQSAFQTQLTLIL